MILDVCIPLWKGFTQQGQNGYRHPHMQGVHDAPVRLPGCFTKPFLAWLLQAAVKTLSLTMLLLASKRVVGDVLRHHCAI